MDGVVGLARPSCLAVTYVGMVSAARRSQLGLAEPCCSGCNPLAIRAERLADPPLSLRGSWRCSRMLCGPGDTAIGDCVGPPPSFLSLLDIWVVYSDHACIFDAVYVPRGRVVRGMMFGFGDSMPPSPASVRLMEEMVIEYIVALVTKTMDVAASRRRDRPDVTDVKFVIRKDDRKMQRVRYLLDMQAHIQTATKDGKNLTAAYAEEAAAAALNTSGAPGGPAAAGSRGTHSGSAGALGVAGSGSAGKGAAHPPASSGAPGEAKPVGAKTSGGGGAGGGPGKASAFKPPPAPR